MLNSSDYAKNYASTIGKSLGVARHEKVDFHLQRRKYTRCISLTGIHILSEIIMDRTLNKTAVLA